MGGSDFNYSRSAGTPTPLEAGRGISAETRGLNDVFPPNNLYSGPYKQFII